MKLSHLFLILLVVALWGMNFAAIKIGSEAIPPLFLAALRMFLTGVPFVFFIKKPATSWKWIAAYGLTIFTLNFGFLFAGMKLGVSAGLTSLIFQTQVFFTIGLSAVIFKERVKPIQIACALVAFCGLAVIAIHRGGTMTLPGFICIITACLSWAFGNIVSKKIGKVYLLGLVVWGGLISSIPLFIVSYFIEGTAAYSLDWAQLPTRVYLAIGFLVYPTTLLGFSLWSWLLNHYKAPALLPFTLLVPVFGIITGTVVLDEIFDTHQILGMSLVFLGVGLNVFASLPRKISIW